MVAGGFDPVPVPAIAGDTLELEIREVGSDTLLRFALAVPVRRPPVVVRTDPPPRKRDVPLNATMFIVFSEPIDPATLTGATVQLLSGTTPVAGQLAFADPARLSATLVPGTALAPSTDYQLVVTQGISDLDGEPLDSSLTVEFTTESESAPVASISVDPPVLTLTPGATLPVRATARNSAGNPLEGRLVTWSSADPAVATISSTAIVTGIALGTTDITATVEGKSATATVNVTSLRFAAVSAGHYFACGITIGGAAYCWGSNWGGQLGMGSSDGNAIMTTPVAVSGAVTFASLSAGWNHVCGIATDGTAYCWGYGYGGLGHAATDVCEYADETQVWQQPCSTRPIPVEGGLRFVAMTAGASHSCAVTADGAAYCWGSGWFGELGTGEKYISSVPPVPVSGGLSFKALSAGGMGGGWGKTCGITTDGRAYCWGGSGSLGYIPTEVCEDVEYSYFCSPAPVPVPGGLTFASLDAEWDLVCGVTTGAATYCWGIYPEGQSLEPVPVSGGQAFATVTAGYQNTACGVTPSGVAYCWGRIATAFGPGWVQSEFSSIPRLVPGSLVFTDVSVGHFHLACGLTSEGVAYCWGQNSRGALGDGSTTSSLVPRKVSGQP
jgi:alpha-tubulin suppressor-like RCC1 family protein